MRRTTLTALAIGALAVSTLAACSDDDNDTPDDPATPTVPGATIDVTVPAITTANT